MTEMLRYNTGKPRYSMLPSSLFRLLFMTRSDDLNIQLINDISKVAEFGAAKYSKDNWRIGGSWCKVADSALRHLISYIDGDVYDPESGLPHLAHVGWNIMALIEFQTYGIGLDDRYKRPKGQKIVGFDEEASDVHTIFDLIARWLEGDDDDNILHAMIILNDAYAEEVNNGEA